MVIWITRHLLDRKKQLSKIWLAAHWEKKIKRAQIYEIDIEKSVQDILDAEIIFDLRISGHLLVGIVKIHARKSKYLLTECSNIFYQVKLFRSGGIDLPADKQTAALDDITLTEMMDNFFNIQNNVIDSIFTANQTHIDEITLKETSKKLTLMDDDDLMDFVFHEEDNPMVFDDYFLNDDEEIVQVIKQDAALKLNGKNKKNEECIIENPIDFNLRSDENMGCLESVMLEDISINPVEEMANGLTIDLPQKKTTNIKKRKKSISVDKVYISEATDSENIVETASERPKNFNSSENGDHLCNNSDFLSKDSHCNKNSDYLLLEPVRKTVVASQTSKIKKAKKKKVYVDSIKAMSYETLKKQVLDTSDIASIPDLAPATKQLMILKENGCVEQLFKKPVLRFGNSKLLKLYQRNLKTCKCNDETESSSEFGDSFEIFNGFETESSTRYVEPKTIQGELEPDIMSDNESSKKNNMADNLQDIGDNFILDPETGNLETEQVRDEEFDQQDIGDNLILDAETGNLETEQVRDEEFDHCVPQNDVPLNSEERNGSNDFVSTQTSKASEEKRAYALQGKIIELLQRLKLLFEKESVICFSSLVQNKRKLWVAQQFLCVLMLKKYEVIAIEQSEPFSEIFISPEINFDGACSKFCSDQ